jgi:hypothetical protein
MPFLCGGEMMKATDLAKYIMKMSEMVDKRDARIKELEVENERITHAYKALITKLNSEDRSDINISP